MPNALPDEISLFEKNVKKLAKDSNNPSPEEVAFICQITFKGVEEFLEVDLDIMPIINIFDAKESLNRIIREYRKLKKQSINMQLEKKIKKVMPVLEKAVSQINAAALIWDEIKDDQIARHKSLSIYHDAIQACYNQVVIINDIFDSG